MKREPGFLQPGLILDPAPANSHSPAAIAGSALGEDLERTRQHHQYDYQRENSDAHDR